MDSHRRINTRSNNARAYPSLDLHQRNGKQRPGRHPIFQYNGRGAYLRKNPHRPKNNQLGKDGVYMDITAYQKAASQIEIIKSEDLIGDTEWAADILIVNRVF